MKHSPGLKLPEEIELEHKVSELVALRSQHAEATEVLRKLEADISRFEKIYQRTLGKRIAELERLEQEIANFSGYSEHLFEREESVGSDAAVERAPEGDIKALYREVAKAIHPDLAGDGDRHDRHELMSKANKAYAEEDRQTLETILRDWKCSADLVTGDDIGADLVRVIRMIARERQEIQGVKDRIAELKDSYICRLKLKVDTNFARGSDLFADLCAAADLNIARARRRLALLKGVREEHEAARAIKSETRTVCFSTEESCGTLFVRDRNSANFSQWKAIGGGKGGVEVGVDQALRLDVKGDVSSKLGLLRLLGPNDLQSLFIYEATDADVARIAHLTGLEELYLSGRELGDGALRRLAPLTSLKRLYLYHTQVTNEGLRHLKRLTGLQGLTCSGSNITDDGLASIEKSMPGVKTVHIPAMRFARASA